MENNAICPKCGKYITVDECEDAAVCPECGAAIVVASAIEKYKKATTPTAACTKCGEHIVIDVSEDAAICPKCGAAIIVERAVRKFVEETTEFLIEDGVLVRYNGKGGDIIIPDGVREIGSALFFDGESDNTTLTSVVIPEGTKRIGSNAFRWCKNLRTVILPAGLLAIGDSAFLGCDSLKMIDIPASVTELGDEAFSYCRSLVSVTLPERIKEFEHGYFMMNDLPAGCESALKRINIPEGLTSFSAEDFYGCSNVSSIHVARGNSAFKVVDGVLYSKDGRELVMYPAGRSDESFRVPEGVERICDFAFAFAHLREIYVPRFVTSIGRLAFSCAELKRVELENTEWYTDGEGFGTDYGEDACDPELFARMISGNVRDGEDDISEERLKCDPPTAPAGSTGVSKGERVDELPTAGLGEIHVFTKEFEVKDGVLLNYKGGNDARAVTIPAGITCIANGTFLDFKALEKVYLPEGIKNIRSMAFSGCENLVEVNFPDSLCEIGSAAFHGCKKLEQIDLPDGLKKIGSEAFKLTGLKSVSIPAGVQKLEFTFCQCEKLEKVIFKPHSELKSVHSAFMHCKSLADITLPKSLESLETPFSWCENLTYVKIPPNVKRVHNLIDRYCTAVTHVVFSDPRGWLCNKKGIGPSHPKYSEKLFKPFPEKKMLDPIKLAKIMRGALECAELKKTNR